MRCVWIVNVLYIDDSKSLLLSKVALHYLDGLCGFHLRGHDDHCRVLSQNEYLDSMLIQFVDNLSGQDRLFAIEVHSSHDRGSDVRVVQELHDFFVRAHFCDLLRF